MYVQLKQPRNYSYVFNILSKLTEEYCTDIKPYFRATDKSEEAVGSEGLEPQPMIKTVEPAPNVVQPPVPNHDPTYEQEESGKLS